MESLSGHFGTKTLRHQDSSALNYSAEVSGHFAEVSGHFCTGAEVSDGHFGTSAKVSVRQSVLGAKCPIKDLT